MNSFLRAFRKNLVFYYFLSTLFILAFLYGVIVGKFRVFPYPILNNARDIAKSYSQIGLAALLKNYPVWISPARHEGSGIVTCKADKAYPGVTMMSGYWNNGKNWFIGIRLIDMQGNILHDWQVEPRKIWPKFPYTDYGARWDKRRKTNIQGAILLPDGSVIFNVDYLGLLRLNANSEVVWKLSYRTHHSIFLDDHNKLWVSGRKWHSKRLPQFPNSIPPFVEETVLKVSIDGVIEREISVLESIYKSGYQGLLFVGGRTNSEDITHLNDVETLTEDKADAFETFNAGDIMISLRNINTIFVLDGVTEMIKWSLTYPFIRQHDPDFTDDGYITVFDNNDDTTRDGSIFGGSRILRINPSSKEVSILYPKENNRSFYTKTSGKHQHLPNGNLLLVESEAGRVFEVTAEGEVVWSFIGQRVDGRNIPEIDDGIRYDMTLADF